MVTKATAAVSRIPHKNGPASPRKAAPWIRPGAVASAAVAALRAAEANVRVQTARLKSIAQGATPEEFEIARGRIAEADAAIAVAPHVRSTTCVTAPFDSTVVELRTESGKSVTADGVVVRLVSFATEIQADVDESNLPGLANREIALARRGGARIHRPLDGRSRRRSTPRGEPLPHDKRST
jgi:hypothetical protein